MFYYKSSEYKWNDGDFENGTVNDYAAFICEWDAPAAGGFVDVRESDYFAPYVLWAVETGIMNSTSANTFSPHDICTVSQTLTYLWRAEGSAEPGISNPFSDVKESDDFFKPALWAYKIGLLSGSALNGNAPCTRATAVTYLWQLAGQPVEGSNPFSDVPHQAAYAQAVAWAVEQGIASGTSATTFSPDQTCTRAQMAAFLYEYLSLRTPVANSGIDKNPEIFNKETSFWGDVSYVYNGTELQQNSVYRSAGNTIIGNMEIPEGAKVYISGDLEITGHVSLSSGTELSCNGNLVVSPSGILDLSSGGTVSCDKSFVFDSATDHKRYLTAGLIEIGDDFESKRNFFASGSNEVHVLGYRIHTINMWDKWISDDQYFNVFRVVGHGINVLDIKELFHCKAEKGFLMDNWSWLKVDYYGSDFEFVGVRSPSESLKGILQTGLMLAIASEGTFVELDDNIEYIDVDVDEFDFSVYSPLQKKVVAYTLKNISVTGIGLMGGKAVTGKFMHDGSLYGFSTSPKLCTKIWNDFKNTTASVMIAEVGDEYLDAYKNIVKSLISDVLPGSFTDAYQITSMMEEHKEVFERYQTIVQIND